MRSLHVALVLCLSALAKTQEANFDADFGLDTNAFDANLAFSVNADADSSESSSSDASDSSSGVLAPGKYGYRLAAHLMPVHLGSQTRQTRSSFFGDNSCKTPICDNEYYRSADGSCNNLRRTSWGQAGLPFKRLLPENRDIGYRCSSSKGILANPRDLSRLVIKRGEEDRRPDLSQYVMVWGQVIDHDLELTPPRSRHGSQNFPDCCSSMQRHNEDCCPIQASSKDFFFGRSNRPRCMPLIRSRLARAQCHGKPDVENANTPWVDASFVYGSSEERMRELRLLRHGLLRVDRDFRGRTYAFAKNNTMQFGDGRSDVHPAFTLLATVFVRNHNRLARALSRRHRNWDDEKLFQETRKINAALVQHITYTDFMDALLGEHNDVSLTLDNNRVYNQVYNPNVEPTVSMVFSTAAFRLHTFVSGHFDCRDEQYRVSQRLRLRDVFHKTDVTKANNTFDELARGLAAQPLQDFNTVYSPEMTEWLFTEEGDDFGMDIVTLNIQRGRDHKLQPYIKYREYCKLGRARTWSDLSDLIPSHHVRQLSRVYSSPADVDMYVAGVMERHRGKSLLGPTFNCLVSEQFQRLKLADRFFYTNRNQFNARQLTSIKRMTLARVICDNADNGHRLSLPIDVFRRPDPVSNPVVSCRDVERLPSLDMDAWGYVKKNNGFNKGFASKFGNSIGSASVLSSKIRAEKIKLGLNHVNRLRSKPIRSGVRNNYYY